MAMLQTLEAVISEDGTVRFLEEISFSGPVRALITILEETSELPQRPFGLCAGEFVVPKDFDESLPEDTLALFEGA